MATSKLIARRKKSTVLVSARTLQDAIQRANLLVESMMEANPNDPAIDRIEAAVQHMSSVLKATPQQMRQDGASSVSDYMDDAKMPDHARKLKSEVDMISKMHGEQRGGTPAAPAQQEVGYVPDSAVAQGLSASAKQADSAGFVTDRDEKAEAKMPETAKVPRIAKKKKEAEDPVAEAPAAAPAPVPAEAAPAEAPAASGNPIDYIPTETLIKVIQDLPKEDDFAQNRGKQDAVVQLTEILKQRPVLPPEQPEAPAAAPAQSTAPALAAPAEPAAAPAPVAASAKTADLGDHAMGRGETISNGSGASAEVGQGGSSPAPAQVSPETSKPDRAGIGYGGLSLASSLDEGKTADDYRMQDFKVTEEGVRPTGGLPDMEEQEEHGVPHGVGFPEDVKGIAASLDALTAAAKDFVAKAEKVASFGGWFTSYKPLEVDEDGGRTPEIAEAHAGLEDHTGIDHPETTPPIKLKEQSKTGAKVAQAMTTGKAVKEAEKLGEDLKKMYLDAKALTQVNGTTAVRSAVEGIFRAADGFDAAVKALVKQREQEESEALAAEAKAKNKKSALGGLALAASAE